MSEKKSKKDSAAPKEEADQKKPAPKSEEAKPKTFTIGSSGIRYTRKTDSRSKGKDEPVKPRRPQESDKPTFPRKPKPRPEDKPYKAKREVSDKDTPKPYPKKGAGAAKKPFDKRKPAGKKTESSQPFYNQFKPKPKAIHYKQRTIESEEESAAPPRSEKKKPGKFSKDERFPGKDKRSSNKETPKKFSRKKDGPDYVKKPSRPEEEPGPKLIRLNKYISNAGFCSRRKADEYIKEGKVSVNGVVVKEVGTKVLKEDKVVLEGTVVEPGKKVYVLLNKPKDVICTTSDERGRRTVMDYVQQATEERIYPVGRLDRNTTGLLLLTNDGELSQKLAHPSSNVSKLYKVTLDKPVNKVDFERILKGVKLEEGVATVDDLAYTDDTKKVIGIELHIGWNRVIRRIFEALGYDVVKLDRVLFAGLSKKDLPRGKWRYLTDKELIRLRHFI